MSRRSLIHKVAIITCFIFHVTRLTGASSLGVDGLGLTTDNGTRRDDLARNGPKRPDVQELLVKEDLVTEEYLYYQDFEVLGRNDTAHVSSWTWNSMDWSWYVILQLMSAIIGLFGNLLVILVVFRRQSAGPTFEILVGNLAIADLLTSLFLIPHPSPKNFPNSWLGILYCKVWESNFLMWTAAMTSTYLLVVISLDRLFVVVYPIRFKLLVTKRRVSFIVLLVWLWSAGFNSSLCVFRVVDEKLGKCVFVPFSGRTYTASIWVIFIVWLALPMAVMVLSHVAIARSLRLKARQFSGGQDVGRRSFHHVARSRILSLMLVVVVVYIVCWAPSHVLLLIFSIRRRLESYIDSPLHRIVIIVLFYNSCANPVIYAVRNPQFVQAVREFCMRGARRTSPMFVDVETANTNTDTAVAPKFVPCNEP